MVANAKTTEERFAEGVIAVDTFNLLKEQRDAAMVEAEQSKALARRWEARAKLAQSQVASLIEFVQGKQHEANNTVSDGDRLLRSLNLEQ